MGFSIPQAHDASTPSETTDTPADRAVAFGLVRDGVTAGLSIPEQINIFHFRCFELRFDDSETDAVDRWAAYLNLNRPRRGDRIHDLHGEQPWKVYESVDSRHPKLPGWSVRVVCNVPATAGELAAARDARTASGVTA